MLRWLKRHFGSATDHADAHSLSRLGEAALAQGHPVDAAGFFRRAIAKDAGAADLHRHLAMACRAQGDLVGAETAYLAALRLQPDDVSTQIKLGAVYIGLGRFQDARRWLESAVQASPEFAAAHLRLGDLFLEQRQWEQAILAYREAVRLEPGSAVAHIALARALEVGGDVESAVETYEAALRIDPQSVEAHVSRATVRLAREEFGAGWD